MSGKNTYLQVQKEVYVSGWNQGIETGMQFAWDCIQLALRDREAVGKDTFGRNRIKRLFVAFRKKTDYFSLALHNQAESDVRQEHLDRMLTEIWGEDFVEFKKRYEHIGMPNYGKPKKKWLTGK